MDGPGEPMVGESHRPDGGALGGCRVLVTRAAPDAEKLIGDLEAEGAQGVAVPLIHILPPRSWEPLDGALARLGRYQWLLFTSRNGVRSFFSRWEGRREAGAEAGAGAGTAPVKRAGAKATWPQTLQVGAVGPGTADQLERYGVPVDLVPEKSTGAGLFEALRRTGVAMDGMRVLLPRAMVARPELPGALEAAGARVDAVTVYRTAPLFENGERLRALLEEGWPHAIAFTSGSTVRSCLTLLGSDAPQLLAGVRVAVIGPTTRDAATELGLEVHCVAEPHTSPGLVRALANEWTRGER